MLISLVLNDFRKDNFKFQFLLETRWLSQRTRGENLTRMSAPSAQNPSPQWTKHSSPVDTRSVLAVWKIVIRNRIPTPPLSIAQSAGPQPTKSSSLARGITSSTRSETMARNAGLLAVVSALERSSHLLPTRCHRQDFESKFYSSFTYGHFMKFSFTLFYVYGISFHSWLFRKLCFKCNVHQL